MPTEQPRPDANGDEMAYSLSVEEAALRYEAAGHPRTLRAIQKYCLRGDLECIKQETLYGQRYRITPASVARHLAQIEEVTRANSHDRSRRVAADRSSQVQSAPGYTERMAITSDAPTREQTRTVAPVSQQETPAPAEPRPAPASPDQPRQTAAEAEAVSRYVARLEGENTFLREQITVKDVQIKDLTERARETNHLIGGLQRMLTPLLGRPRTENRDHTYDVGTPTMPENRDRAYGIDTPPAPETDNHAYTNPPQVENGLAYPTGDNSELRL